jgi:hypothetical protein
MAFTRLSQDKDEAQVYALLAIAAAISALAVAVEDRPCRKVDDPNSAIRVGKVWARTRQSGPTVASTIATSAPEGIRTPNLLIRSQMLYPLSYGRMFSCGGGSGI